MMIALIGLNANAAMYIVGDAPFGGWNPGAGVQMTDNGDGTYSYTVELNGQVGFVFGDGQNSDWVTFNSNYRYGPATGNTTIQAGNWIATQKAGDHGCYYFTGTGDSYVFTFDKTNSRFKVEGYVAPIEESYTVCGDNATIFGTTWDPENTANDMTLDTTDGLYKLVKENVVIDAGTLYYKVAKNHGWAESWGDPEGPSGNQNYVFNENGTYNLTFKFNLETKEVSLDASMVQVGPEIDPITGHLYIAGQVNDNGWDPSQAIEMVNDGDDDTFTLANAQITDSGNGYGYFSFMAMRGTSAQSWPADGYRIGAAEDGTDAVLDQFIDMGGFGTTGAFKVEPGYYNITVVLSAGEHGKLKLTAGQAPEPVVDDVYIMGDVNNLGWDATKGVQMTYNEGIYTANITTQNQGDLGIAYFGFTKKLAETNDSIGWASIEGFRFGPVSEGAFVMTEELLGNECSLATDGSYESIAIPEGSWSVTVDLVNNKFTINGEWPTDTITPEPEADVYILGDVNNIGWNATDGVKMTFNEGIYTANITTQNQGDLGIAYFGFTKKLAETNDSIGWASIAPFRFGPVSEGAFVMTEELLGNECTLATDGSYESIAIPEGTWTVTVDLVNNKFTINGEWPIDTITPEPEGNVYIIGEVNDKNWAANDGVQMTFDEENNVYTATVTFDGRNAEGEEGAEELVNYFGLTKKLGANDQDWATLNANRLGSETDGNYWVTPELMGQELGLVCPIDMAYRIAKGEYTITVDLENMTLVINQAGGLRGDVDNNKEVGIADVSALIDYLLSGDASAINLQNANCNLDGEVGIADVSALIDYLLSGVWND